MSGPATKAELIGTLDEKYVANVIAFESMIAAAALVLDGEHLRGPDGSIDLDGVRARLAALTWQVPAMRQRLAPTPLRLTTPAWVPVEDLDIAAHVTLHPDIEPDDPNRVEILTGRLNGPMDLSRPLWDFLVVELDSGRVAIVARYHHVIGDALFGLKIGDVVAGTAPSSLLPAITDDERAAVGVPPRTGFGILAIAGRAWLADRDGFAGAWHEYWRKPFTRRLRRWGGRVIRPLKNRAIVASGEAERLLVPRHSRYVEVDLPQATKLAYRLGGTVHDLTVAATLRAVAMLEPDSETVSLLVPISRRSRTDDAARNHISVVKVTVPTADPLELVVPSVRAQVQAAVDDRSPRDLGAPDWRGYATSITWGPRQRFFGEAPVRSVTGWPAGDPRDDLACLSCSYGRTLSISVTARATTDVDAVIATIAASFSGVPTTVGR
ncbi:Wax ester synthase-like Acyl-CoA acyltransferase domain-containing protein [Agromyces sp. CF514]|uniref:wax ester/triacylglycerol synthase domain-containing protein n=1 Tax=Agromyces sp. CF514 TaxID=1881031 RepID=UPI0008EE3083|nr:wax ester/triacylglycerol synthase domain-containing protein [Agromyces sp. CF514]SFR72292.1 Wax ester synthase-like Acyl-CoA acyltransferase domain-containing protein [Agromyces sp. CF514]